MKLSQRALVVNVCFLTSLRSPARTLIYLFRGYNIMINSFPSLS